MEDLIVGDTAFWHDPDADRRSGVGYVEEVLTDGYTLTLRGGETVEARVADVTRVSEDDVVGVNAAGFLLYHSASFEYPYSDGDSTEKTEHCLDDEERRRVAASRKRLGNT